MFNTNKYLQTGTLVCNENLSKMSHNLSARMIVFDNAKPTDFSS